MILLFLKSQDIRSLNMAFRFTATTTAAVATRQESNDDSMLSDFAPSTPNSTRIPMLGITTRRTSTPSTLALDDDTDTSVSTILTTTTASSVPHATFSAADLQGFADTVRPGLDIFPGKGEAIKRLNYHYRILIRDYHLAYTNANSDASKNQIALALFQEIQRQGGNFLRNREGDYMTEKESLTKIKKALKDYKTRENRRLARQKSVARRLKRQSLAKQPSTRSIQTDLSHVSLSTSVADYSYCQDESCHPPSVADVGPGFGVQDDLDAYPVYYQDESYHPPSTIDLDPYPAMVTVGPVAMNTDQHPESRDNDNREWMEMIDLLSALE